MTVIHTKYYKINTYFIKKCLCQNLQFPWKYRCIAMNQSEDIFNLKKIEKIINSDTKYFLHSIRKIIFCDNIIYSGLSLVLFSKTTNYY